MNLGQIRKEAWDWARETGTTDQQRLWTTTEMNRYINRIYRHIARETKCIRDATTTAVCRITVTPEQDLELYDQTDSNFGYSMTVQFIDCTYDTGSTTVTTTSTTGLNVGTLLVSDALTTGTTVATIIDTTSFTVSANPIQSGVYSTRFHIWITPLSVALHATILDIDEVKWTQKAWKLNKVSVNKWRINPWWEWVLGTMATECATDYQNNMITMNYRTVETDTLKLSVRRLPLTDLTADSDEPEFRTHYHDFMLNGILWLMYSKQDTQTFDAVKALDYRQRFLEDISEIKQQEVILDQMLHPNHSMDAFR